MRDPSLNGREQRIIKTDRRDAACRVSCGARSVPRCRGRGKPRLYGMECVEPFLPLGGYPIVFASGLRDVSAVFEMETIEEIGPIGSELRSTGLELIAEC